MATLWGDPPYVSTSALRACDGGVQGQKCPNTRPGVTQPEALRVML